MNDPRSSELAGFTWNEKWIYRGADGRAARLVLWNRYDLVAVLRRADGSAGEGDETAWLAEPLPGDAHEGLC